MRYAVTTLSFVLVAAVASAADVNRWEQISENAVGPGFSPGLVWVKDLGRFVRFGGQVSHAFRGERPYDVQTFDVAERQWFNHLPKNAKERGGETGFVKDPGFKSPYFAMKDNAGLVAPNRRHMRMWYKYALAPWDEMIYALVCGRTLRYDPKARAWKDLDPKTGPSPKTRSFSVALSWAAMCADPVNKEIVLFGGCGLSTRRAGPGTWIYSTEKNEWRELKPDVQPPVRVLSPMVCDPATKKIVLFGGDRLDQLYADTWVYDCATRTWEERKPAVSPSPRFGHALLYLPKAKTVLLVGGKGYTLDGRYRTIPLPFQMWTYDVAKNEWTKLASSSKPFPPQNAVEAAVAAVDENDTLLFIGLGTKRSRPRGRWNPHSTWLCQVDASKGDAEGTAKSGVAPGTITRRTKSCDPDWFAKDLPAPDVKAQEKLLAELPANQWVTMKYKKYPGNRNNGGWSTTAFDTDGDQILHLGGGHVSYFGNDVAIYDIATGRWSISCTPQFALEFNGGLSGPGPYALNLAPWGNHNYHAYCYDSTIKRLVYMKHMTQLYNPETKLWSFDEKIKTPFRISKYTTYVVPTPQGVVAWTHVAHQTCGVFRLESGKKWVKLPLKGKLPVTVCDGAAAVYDSKRDQLLMVTTLSRSVGVQGQVWSYSFKTGECRKLNPTNMAALKTGRFAREAVYLPKADLMMLGYLLKVGGKSVVPFYDPAKNEWLVAEQPGSKFLGGRGGVGCSVGLGLAYDPKRDLVWGVLCDLRPGHLRALRFDRAAANLNTLE